MTAKHYRMFANVLAGTRPASNRSDYPFAYAQWARDVNAIASMFAAHSGGFNKQQFLDAVGAIAPLEPLK